jgi:hypothetical protein
MKAALRQQQIAFLLANATKTRNCSYLRPLGLPMSTGACVESNICSLWFVRVPLSSDHIFYLHNCASACAMYGVQCLKCGVTYCISLGEGLNDSTCFQKRPTNYVIRTVHSKKLPLRRSVHFLFILKRPWLTILLSCFP